VVTLAHYAPEQVAALTSTALNVANYVNSKRPQPKMIGPLNKPVPVSSALKNVFYKTLQMAENPMVIFKRMSDGTLHSRDVVDFKSMYPSLYDSISKKTFNQIMDHTGKDKPVPFKIRKGLSSVHLATS
jgi:hypothetical protein